MFFITHFCGIKNRQSEIDKIDSKIQKLLVSTKEQTDK